MCLSVAVARPGDVLAKGEHSGHEFMVVHNGRGYRCGYVKVEPGHPWHGKEYDGIDADVHGGLTFGKADVHCGKGGEDSGWWLGFDFAHGGDSPDPSLPGCHRDTPLTGDRVWTTAEVEQECRHLCEQAAQAK